MDCTGCEHYEKYEGDKLVDGEKAVMRCNMPKKSSTGPHYGTLFIGTQPCMDGFTPKKPEPEKPKEKPGCATISPEEYERQLAAQQAQSSAMYGGLLGGSYPFGGSAAQAARQQERLFGGEANNYSAWIPKKPKPIKSRKERTMLKKTLHLYRMAGMLWLTYGHYIVMAWLTPWLVKVVNLGLGILPDVEKVVDGEYVMMPPRLIEGAWGLFGAWAFTILAILAVCAFMWAWSKATKFWYNEK